LVVLAGQKANSAPHAPRPEYHHRVAAIAQSEDLVFGPGTARAGTVFPIAFRHCAYSISGTSPRRAAKRSLCVTRHRDAGRCALDGHAPAGAVSWSPDRGPSPTGPVLGARCRPTAGTLAVISRSSPARDQPSGVGASRKWRTTSRTNAVRASPKKCVVPGSTASCEDGTPVKSPLTSPPRNCRNLTACPSLTASQSPTVIRVGAAIPSMSASEQPVNPLSRVPQLSDDLDPESWV
jgi:hypothetical protein